MRSELDGVMNYKGQDQLLSIKALNEFDPKHTGEPDLLRSPDVCSRLQVAVNLLGMLLCRQLTASQWLLEHVQRGGDSLVSVSYDAGVDWRQKMENQRGAVLATELKNNANKLAKWTAAALVSGADMIKLGYVSRVHMRDNFHHAVLGTQVDCCTPYIPAAVDYRICISSLCFARDLSAQQSPLKYPCIMGNWGSQMSSLEECTPCMQQKACFLSAILSM